MPTHKNEKKQKSKRSKQPGAIGAMVSPFPSLRQARTRYTDTIILTESAVGVGAYNGFTPSGLYDPNATGSGHQPMYYDQLCAAAGPYTKYRALKSTIKVTFSNLGTGTIYCGWYIQPVVPAPSSLSVCMEKPWSAWTTMSGTNGGQSVKTMTVTVPHFRALGITPSHMKTDDYYAGDWNANPLRLFYFVPWVNSQVTSVASAMVTVEIDTTSEFFGLTNTPAS